MNPAVAASGRASSSIPIQEEEELLGGDGLREERSLTIFALEAEQLGVLVLALDPFGDGSKLFQPA